MTSSTLLCGDRWCASSRATTWCSLQPIRTTTTCVTWCGRATGINRLGSGLQQLLNRYNSAYLQEKCSGNPEIGAECGVSAPAGGVFHQRTASGRRPMQVLWNAFDLNTAVMGRAKILYGRLRRSSWRKRRRCADSGTLCGAAHRIQQSGGGCTCGGRGGFLGGTSRGGSVCGPGGFSPRHPKPPLCPERDYPSLVQLVFQSIPSPEIVGHLRG